MSNTPGVTDGSRSHRVIASKAVSAQSINPDAERDKAKTGSRPGEEGTLVGEVIPGGAAVVGDKIRVVSQFRRIGLS